MRIAVLGTGNMGRALIGGLLRAYGDAVRIAGYDKMPQALEGLGCGVEIIAPQDWKSFSFVPDVVIISVKPADIHALLDTLTPLRSELNFLTISIAAGISISSIKEKLGSEARICRCMSNTPALIGEGMSAYSLSENCAMEDVTRVEYIFNACGKVQRISENLIDAVTGLSGSGPAFVFSFIEALAEGGVSAGLPYKSALDAAVQTVIGAAKMAQTTSEHPSVLKSKVMSPGGTTVRGLEELERGAFRHSVIQAVKRAAARANELAGGSDRV
ncbi:MAG: pyrroline-5-carboxylate reductase [Chitinispirillales bacterium]|jgi:pyrroline-5-carboxylate reductase|nr:pyrroline-5-carboxylate reductase [Chitinispirillales bacterium]